jgi:hypothetical protein
MNFLANYEAPLRSYIEESIAVLGNALEEELRNCTSVDITLLEQQFDQESENFIGGITRRIHEIRDEIKAHRPTNIQSDDYENQMIQYRLFIQSSSISMNRMTDWINTILKQITGIIKWIVQWMEENVQTIADILEQIRDAFAFIGTFFQSD